MKKRSANHHIKQAAKKPNWFRLDNYSNIIFLEPHELFSIIRDRLDILNCLDTRPSNTFHDLKIQAALSRFELIKSSPLDHYKSIGSLAFNLARNELNLDDLANSSHHIETSKNTVVREVKNGVIFSLNDAISPLNESDYHELDYFFKGINPVPKRVNDDWIFEATDNTLEEFFGRHKNHIKIDLHQPKQKIISDFTKWLDTAKEKLETNTPKRENFEFYRSGLARHRVIEYLDLEIYNKIDQLNIKGPVISEWLDIDIKDLEATRTKVKTIKSPKFLEWLKGFSEHLPLSL